MPSNKVPREFRAAVAAIVVVGLAGTLLLAQDDLESLRQAAEQGDAEAQFRLGFMYANGRGVPEDDAEAVRWYRLASVRGHASAQYNLGYMYATGEGVPRDYTEAALWLRLAMAQDDASGEVSASLVHSGSLHLGGHTVPQDAATAAFLFRLAAEQGNPAAQYYLGVMYGNGEGVLKDSVLAHMWLNIAGANGNAHARELRDDLEHAMSRREIRRATELARACMASDYQDCGP